MSPASGSSDGGQGWPRYGPVPLIRSPKCERSESLVRLRSKRWENDNFGREFLKCENKPYQLWSESLWMEKLRLSSRTVVENKTDLKEKRLFSPRQLTFWLIVNVRDMNVILSRLRPVPINR